jgi:DNA-binding NarL/FixJ family response regulator
MRRELLDAIRDVQRGRRHLHPEIANEIAMHVVNDDLSTREIAVLELVSVGKANKQIALALGLAEETVKAHLRSIFSKLDVTDRTHAVTIAARRGIIDL